MTEYPNMVERLAKFPARIFTPLNTDPCLVTGLVPGVQGYHPIRRFDSPDVAQAQCDRLNERYGADAAQVQAAEVGAMFGWHVPGADPDYYRLREAAKESGGDIFDRLERNELTAQDRAQFAALDAGIKKLAAQAWATHPNNPANRKG